jgi:hypothetical protein
MAKEIRIKFKNRKFNNLCGKKYLVNNCKRLDYSNELIAEALGHEY